MAGGTRRGKKAHAGAKAPRRPALGNDPFARGAAAREPFGPARRVPAASAAPTPVSTPAPAESSLPAPTPIPLPAPAPPATAESTVAEVAGAVAARVSGVERRLDAALDGVETRLQELAARAGLAAKPGELRDAIARLLPAVRQRLASAVDLVRLLDRPGPLDRFGMDARFAERLEPVVDLVASVWWRVEVRDVERVPAEGPAIVVANHGGAVPWDAFVLRHALRKDHPAHRDLRPLLDDRECRLPVIGAAAIRYGAVRATAEAADAILAAGGVAGVFPEGSAAALRPWRERYRIQRFGRGGFAKVALRAGAPVVPCAIVGSEEASPGIARTGWLADLLGIPVLSASPSLRVASAALLPLPSRWTLRFGEPIEVRPHGPEAASDPAVVNAIAEQARAALQALLDEAVAARSSVWL